MDLTEILAVVQLTTLSFVMSVHLAVKEIRKRLEKLEKEVKKNERV